MSHVSRQGVAQSNITAILQSVQSFPHRVFKNRPGAQGMETRPVGFANATNPAYILRKAAHIAHGPIQYLHLRLAFHAPA
jgi:hypothetical protein